MTQSIGQRLYDIFLENQRGVVYQMTQWKSLLESDRQCCEHAATELLRGVLTGEIPMPDELMKSGYFVLQINPEAVANDDLESFEGTFQHHNPSVVL